MPQNETIVVTGYSGMMKALLRADKDEKKYVRSVFREVGQEIRQDAASLFEPYDRKTAAGYRVYVRQRGVAVEQSLRKTTGKHPEFGSLQMVKALVPALEEDAPHLERGMEHALDLIAAHFEAA
jgi:hypothetical protein